MIDAYLNQTAKWGRRTGLNGHGEPVYSESTVKCRIERDSRMSESVSGEKAQWGTMVYLKEPVEPGDTLMGLKVKSVEVMADIGGGEAGRAVTI